MEGDAQKTTDKKPSLRQIRRLLEKKGLPKYDNSKTTPTFYEELFTKMPETFTSYGVNDYRPVAWVS